MLSLKQKKYLKAWVIKNKNSSRYKKHKSKAAAKYRKANKEKVYKATRKWRIKNKEKYALSRKQKCFNRKLEIITNYGKVCNCCAESEHYFLTIDHPLGNGKQDRAKYKSIGFYEGLKQKGYPKKGYQLLCMNCNFGTRYKQICPHKRNKGEIKNVKNTINT